MADAIVIADDHHFLELFDMRRLVSRFHLTTRFVPALFTIWLAAACASTGATYGSGVGDRMIARAPFYAGARTSPVASADARVAIMPIVFQTRQGVNAMFDPSNKPNSSMAAFLLQVNAYLDSLTLANGVAPIRLQGNGHESVTPPTIAGVPPDVRFGCLTEGDLPGEDCITRGDSALGRVDNLQQMKLSVGRPSPTWITSTAATLESHNASHVLVITIETGEYWMRQSGFAGRKSVELGTNHIVAQPWMTSLETPVQVLQITGALVDLSGKAVRIGAEGIMAKRTPLLASGLGMQALITEEDVAELCGARREDLPGKPLAWQEALRQLVQGLTR